MLFTKSSSRTLKHLITSVKLRRTGHCVGSPFIVFKNSISFVLNLLKLGQHQNFWSNIVESICKKANLFFNWMFGKDEFLPRMYSWFYWSQFSCPAIILVPDLFSWNSRNSFKLCPTGLLLNRTNLVWGG